MSDGNYALELRNYNDRSDVNATIAIGEQILYHVDEDTGKRDVDIVIGVDVQGKLSEKENLTSNIPTLIFTFH